MQLNNQSKTPPRKRPELLLTAAALVVGAAVLVALGLHGGFSSAAQTTAPSSTSVAGQNTNPLETQAAASVQGTTTAPPGASYVVGYTGVVVVNEQPYAAKNTGAATPETKAPQWPVNLNTATQTQLETLPGIGPTKARAILAWRLAHGGFFSPQQLLEVTGIGEKTLEKLLPFITI
ncbi:MAG: helix-hairpin-helix domain-containing protein [Oscillospiraceae bacterium]|nr:helix-hairpin-helix domain-containing protein [Oscillospiraceae bacterium]